MTSQEQIAHTLDELFNDSKYDRIKMVKGAAKSMFRPMQTPDFKDAYLSISREQGEDLVKLITVNHLKNIVEFGTSFGISTLYLAQAVKQTNGKIITTELIESKAQKAIDNFKKAGVNKFIDVRTGDAIETLQNHKESIDLLLLDGWKNLYLPLFQMLEPNFHTHTIIYVDNANMSDSQAFLNTVGQNKKYHLQSKFGNKVVLITLKN
ncbi:O-methyltransferase [Formosa sp. PL04]|uniref:O-methyltransferase n=1 Tax=Formosa sp. PL04 TaxID=3081755 RepID=UPI00298276F3|nr:class I SAM-dependent methyltransferase [Formosa sp. PL04]MDW5288726.1 class I SAM-dependent methyltransferase [Formosa sp. PL04]